jgi:pilus assembly protein Flp/PilA
MGAGRGRDGDFSMICSKKKSFPMMRRLTADESGMAVMEYTILLGTMVVAVIVIMATLGGWATGQWKSACSLIKNSYNSMTGSC